MVSGHEFCACLVSQRQGNSCFIINLHSNRLVEFVNYQHQCISTSCQKKCVADILLYIALTQFSVPG